MTPDERAENIRRIANNGTVGNPEFMRKVAAEIQAAVEERKGNPLAANPSEWFCLDCRPIAEALGKQAVLNAKADAYADAAKLIAGHYASCPSCHGGRCIDELKNALRARAAEACSGNTDGGNEK